jgi:hypothetical protein
VALLYGVALRRRRLGALVALVAAVFGAIVGALVAATASRMAWASWSPLALVGSIIGAAGALAMLDAVVGSVRSRDRVPPA